VTEFHPLSTGGTTDPFLPRLLGEIRRASEIHLAVSFVMGSGLDLVFDALAEALVERRVRLRILTSDYLGVTDPGALRRLLLLAERGAEVGVFQVRDRGFHLKTYLFLRGAEGRAYVGSSNLSRGALTEGIEWNWRVDPRDPPHDPDTRATDPFRKILAAYEELYSAPETRPLTAEWIEAYEARRVRVLHPGEPTAPGEPDAPSVPTPHPVQAAALEALAATRAAGNRRGLVVMATGLGKTWLAAFDVARFGGRRMLYVAHREEILLQAEDTFQRILPQARVGRYDGSRREPGVDLLFASVQTLSRRNHLDRFPADHFHYVVVDEFHHASAPTYRRILRHFQPRFLLGLTATPDRTDGSDILSLCDGNLVHVTGLPQAIAGGFLAPFRYWGIVDETVDYAAIPWRNGRFDPAALDHRLATEMRARHVFREWEERQGSRTLAFCVSRRHADFMAEHFRRQGVRAAAVHGGHVPGVEDDPIRKGRGEALAMLDSGDLDVVFSVDLFNEGVDVPSIDTVLMLRPTESRVLFLQQLGRGLRTAPGKEAVTVLDFIGNHRAFLGRPQVLLEVGGGPGELAEAARRLERGEVELPPGCFVNFDLGFVEFMKALKGEGLPEAYRRIRDELGRRPTATELHRGGGDLGVARREHGQWFALVQAQGDLTAEEARVLAAHGGFLREVETTSMTRSFKMILLQALLENNGLWSPPTLPDLARWSLDIFRRRRGLVWDLATAFRDVDRVEEGPWLTYWSTNPIAAWTGGLQQHGDPWFRLENGRFTWNGRVEEEDRHALAEMIQELVDLQLARYWERRSGRVLLFEDLHAALEHFNGNAPPPDRTMELTPDLAGPDSGGRAVARAGGALGAHGGRAIDPDTLLLLEFGAPPGPQPPAHHLFILEHTAGDGRSEYAVGPLPQGMVLRDPEVSYQTPPPGPGAAPAGSIPRAVARVVGILDAGNLPPGEA